jgi:kinesin family member 1
MLEIYSEVCRDLLMGGGSNQKQGLIIREDPKIGFYPTGLTKKLVSGYEEIVKLTDQGMAQRTIASTNMNATSSRSHTIVTVNLVQKYKNDAGKEMALSSLINLVDLAGSERQEATGATGDRLKEGAAINLSLSMLGNVIMALAQNSDSSKKQVVVPYRDSVLTKLLMNALGGNSKTIMIAAISPAEINYDETVSTLRYADGTKKIKTKATINEDPTEKLIKSLKEENERLKKMLANGKIDPELASQLSGGVVAGGGGAAAAGNNDEAMKKILEDNEKSMKAMQQSYEEKLAEAKNQKPTDLEILNKKAQTIPHLTNINMDPSLSKTIKLILEGDGKKTIGIPGKSDISFKGVGIQDPHGYITISSNKYTIESINNSKILRNGKQLTAPTDLIHLDRLIIGSSHYYLFIDPTKANPKDVDYQFDSFNDEYNSENGIPKLNNPHLSSDEMTRYHDFLDLLPHLNEVNQISIEMDRKIRFTALSVPADICGNYDEKSKPFILVENYKLGLEWIWNKPKFMDRKAQISEYYLDFKDDGIINRDKFKNYDPFFESPDTVTQIGTAIISLKSILYLIPIKKDYKILDFKCHQAGTINIEILPCDTNGHPLNEESIKIMKSKEMIKKFFKTDSTNICFMIKINSAYITNPIYGDIYCEYQMYSDSLNIAPTKKFNIESNNSNRQTTVTFHHDVKDNSDKNNEKKTIEESKFYKHYHDDLNRKMLRMNTILIKGSNKPVFNYSRVYYYIVNREFLNFIEKKSIYIQVFGSQKNPKPDLKLTGLNTQQYFDRKVLEASNTVYGKVPSNEINPEILKLLNEVEFQNLKGIFIFYISYSWSVLILLVLK